MPAFSNPKSLELFGRFIVPGRKIFVDMANGDDGNDGGQNLPYATLARGIQDVRSGRNDFVVVVNGGAPGTGVAADPLVVVGKNGFGIVGLNFPGILPPTNRAALVIPTAWARTSATNATATVPSGHGAVAGDYWFIHSVQQSGTARLRGVGRVTSATATTINFRVNAAGALTDQPYTAPGALGFLTPCPLAFEQCTQVLLAGLSFGADLFTDSLSGCVFSGGISNATISGISVYRNVFGSACLGFYTVPAAANLYGSGQAINVEGNVFSPNFTTFQTNVKNTSHIFLQGGIDVLLADNVMQVLQASVTWGGAAFIEHVQTNPGAGYTITGNKLITNVPAGKFIRSNESGGGGGKIFVEQNYYSDVPVQRENLAVDPNGAIFDRLSTTLPQQDYIPSPLGVVRQGSGVLGSFRVTGGTSLAVQTTATQADNWYNGARVVVYSTASGAAAHAEVASYSATSGTFNLEDALPFTPAAGDAVIVLANHADVARDVWGHALPGTYGANTAGERLATTDDRVDVAVSTRVTPAGVTSAVYGATEVAAGAAGEMGTLLLRIADHVIGDAEIDFPGSDALGWQLVVRDRADAILARYNMFDEANARITGTVATFISNKKAVSRLDKV